MSRTRRTIAAVALLAAVVGSAACGSDQDPAGFTDDTNQGPTTTSHLIAPCPDGGPDATTPAVGCLDEDGNLVQP